MDISHLKRFSRSQLCIHFDEITALNETDRNSWTDRFTIGDELTVNISSESDDIFLYSNTGNAYSVEYKDQYEEWLRNEYIALSVIAINSNDLVCDVLPFTQYLTSTKEWNLAVDDKLVEQISNGKRSAGYFGKDKNNIITKLTEEFVLPSAPRSTLSRVVAAYIDPSNTKVENSFSIVGKRYIAKIQNKDNYFLVVSLTELKNKELSSLALIEGKITFVDETSSGQFTVSAEVQAESARLDSDNSAYLNIWQEYSNIELSQMHDKKDLAGVLRYDSWECKPIDENMFQYRFKLISSDEEKVDNFISIIKEIAGDAVSIEVYDKDKTEDTRFIGKFKKFENNIMVLTSSKSPKSYKVKNGLKGNGFLGLSLFGDEVSHKRRDSAHNAIKNSSNPMPQLRFILDGTDLSFTQRKQSTVSDKDIKRAFGKDTTPTRQQKEAVRLAIETPDIALIQGPPGTGKTQVISAILKLLSERSKSEDKRFLNLLTSYQHDAVDNAVKRTEVFGLPAYRTGKREGEEDLYNIIDEWRQTKYNEVQKIIDDIEEPTLYRSLNEIRELITIFQFSSQRLVSIMISKLDEITQKVEEISRKGISVDYSLIEKLHSEVFKLKSKSIAHTDYELIRLIRSIRTTPEAFLDDGNIQLNRLVTYLKPTLDGNSRISIEDIDYLSSYESDAVNYEKLETIKGFLLDTFLPDRRKSEIYIQDDTINSLLQLVLDEINERVKEIQIGKQDILEEYKNALQYSAFEIEKEIKNYTTVMATTCQRVASDNTARLLGDGVVFENVIIDEAARANPLDLLIPMSVARKKIILVGDHRQLPHMLEPDVEAELSNVNSDNETIANAYSEALKKSLFERLWNQQKEKGRTVTLDKQFRMHPVLGELVSKSFYEIENDGVVKSARPESDFKHSVVKYPNKCAVWIDCSNSEEEMDGYSRYNRDEAQRLASEVESLLETTDESIGVISFYSAQITHINNELDRKDILIKKGNTFILNEKYGGMSRLRIGTVDSFQGMQFGIVLLSTVRTNSIECNNDERARSKYGHLTLPNRLNVAMSRQEKMLIVVGDKGMFNTQAAESYVPGLFNFHQLCGGEYGTIN